MPPERSLLSLFANFTNNSCSGSAGPPKNIPQIFNSLSLVNEQTGPPENPNTEGLEIQYKSP